MLPYAKDDAYFYPLTIYYEDTDAGGVVYHSNYLNFSERARTEWLRHLGIGRERLQNEFGLMFVVRRASIDYRKPARLDDRLLIETRLSGIGKVRMTLRQTVRRDEVVLAVVDVEVVAINKDFIPSALPQALIDLLPAAAVIEEKQREVKN